jgi:hypothetical protein
MGVGGGGGGLATVCTPHISSPLSRSYFSFLHSAVKVSFDIKKAYGKPYTNRGHFFLTRPVQIVLVL